jgi:hypothetical protein
MVQMEGEERLGLGPCPEQTNRRVLPLPVSISFFPCSAYSSTMKIKATVSTKILIIIPDYMASHPRR